MVFTNLSADSNEQLVEQVIKVCDDIGVEVSTDDISAAHKLPSKKGVRHVVRFANRAKAVAVFKHRKNCKNMDSAKKRSVTKVQDRGIGIMPHLTPKRAKFYGQVTNFVKYFNMEGCWVDYHTGNILVRTKPGLKATIVTDSYDLYNLDNRFRPIDHYFCTPPVFNITHVNSDLDLSLVVNKSSVAGNFSPSTPPRVS